MIHSVSSKCFVLFPAWYFEWRAKIVVTYIHTHIYITYSSQLKTFFENETTEMNVQSLQEITINHHCFHYFCSIFTDRSFHLVAYICSRLSHVSFIESVFFSFLSRVAHLWSMSHQLGCFPCAMMISIVCLIDHAIWLIFYFMCPVRPRYTEKERKRCKTPTNH